MHVTPAVPGRPLPKHEGSEPFDGHFNYKTVIGKLNYLEKSSRPDISTAVHMCAKYAADPKRKHGEALKRIGRYLAATRTEGICYDPKPQSFECWADASFADERVPQEHFRGLSDCEISFSRDLPSFPFILSV